MWIECSFLVRSKSCISSLIPFYSLKENYDIPCINPLKNCFLTKVTRVMHYFHLYGVIYFQRDRSRIAHCSNWQKKKHFRSATMQLSNCLSNIKATSINIFQNQNPNSECIRARTEPHIMSF